MKILAMLTACCVALVAGKPEVGKVVDDIKMKSMDAKEIKLSDYRADKEKKVEGAITVVYFWSYKCPSGAPNLPKVKEFAEKVAGDKSGVQLICVSSYGESADDVTKYCKDNEIKYVLCHDADREIAKHFGASQVNSTYVMDKTGKLIFRGGWDDKKTGNFAEASVKAIKDGKDAPASDKKFAG